MKDRLSLAEQQIAEREDQATLRDDLEAVKAQLSQLQDELREVALSRDKAVSECGGLRTKRDEQRNTIDALNNQLERSVEAYLAQVTVFFFREFIYTERTGQNAIFHVALPYSWKIWWGIIFGSLVVYNIITTAKLKSSKI